MVYPYDFVNMKPAMSPNGKYIFKLYFNGCSRKVTIDDHLPASRTERSLHVLDRNNPGLLWPALLEKAYLKVRGGYDFPGSNSGTDILALIGWIPEQLMLQRYDHLLAIIFLDLCVYDSELILHLPVMILYPTGFGDGYQTHSSMGMYL